MKRYLLYVPIILLILLASCFQPESHEGIPDWVNDFIDAIEADTSYTPEYGIGEIWQYEYKGDIVYYMVSSWCDGSNYLYNTEGDFLGCPDGGWTGAGDGSYSDFPSERINGVLIWRNGTTANLDDSQDYAIINAVLDHYYSDSEFIHIIKENNDNIDIENIGMHFNNGDIDFTWLTLSAVKIKNQSDHEWNKDVLPDSSHIISLAEYNNLGWDEYIENYPNSDGLVSFSLPGLSPEGNSAVVVLTNIRGAHSIYGSAIALEKNDGIWSVVGYALCWRT